MMKTRIKTCKSWSGTMDIQESKPKTGTENGCFFSIEMN